MDVRFLLFDHTTDMHHDSNYDAASSPTSTASHNPFLGNLVIMWTGRNIVFALFKSANIVLLVLR